MAAGEDEPAVSPARSRWRSLFPAPERRSRTDLVAAAAIVIGLVIAGTVIWQRGDAQGTESAVASEDLPVPAAALEVPVNVREVWQARDVANDHPVIAAGAVVTADGGTVTGRNPGDGAQRWRYRRDAALCGVEGAFTTAIAVYRDKRGCGQATQLSGGSGRRMNARTSDASDQVTLSTNFSQSSEPGYGFVLSLGSNRLELWRSDMVRTLEYGNVDAPVNPHSQPRRGCQFSSAAFNIARIAVLEQCPGENGNRLSVLKTDPKDSQKPEELGSAVVADLIPKVSGAKVLSVAGERIALYLPPHHGNPARIGIYDSKVSSLNEYPLPAPMTDRAVTVKEIDSSYVWTGADLIKLRGSDLEMSWTLSAVTGTPAEMAGQLLVPVTDGIAVVSPQTGAEAWRIPVRRNGYSGPVRLAVLGSTILEKRGDQLVALRT